MTVSKERIIVGGTSPHIFSIDPALLETGRIIGINQWPLYFRCDWWIGLDTGENWEKFNDWLPALTVPKYMRRPNKTTETNVPEWATDLWFEQPPGKSYIPLQWEGLLRWESSTALAAINLAIILGATEVLLYGVDFVGDERADGHRYNKGLWEQHREPVNNLLRRYQEHVEIRKLHPDSWLDCPLLEDYEMFDLLEPKQEEQPEEQSQELPYVNEQGEVEVDPDKTWAVGKDREPEPEPEPEPETDPSQNPIDPVTVSEREKYEHVWTFDEYRQGSPGLRAVPHFFSTVGPKPPATVVDVGCGMGKASLALRERGLRVTMLDITETCLNPEVREAILPGFLDFKQGCLWELTPADIEPHDFVYCCDLLEHIPKERVGNALNALRYLTKEKAYLNIALYDDVHFSSLTGKTLHMTVAPPNWWITRLQEYFHIDSEYRRVNSMTVIVTPKKDITNGINGNPAPSTV